MSDLGIFHRGSPNDGSTHKKKVLCQVLNSSGVRLVVVYLFYFEVGFGILLDFCVSTGSGFTTMFTGYYFYR